MAGGATQIEMPAQMRVRERALVGLLSVCVFFSVLNTSMFNVSLPEIGHEFAVSPARLGWIVTAYSLLFGVSTPFYGRLGDRYGLRRMLIAGLSLFSVASLLAAIAPTYPVLLICRALQAIGTGAIPSLGTALIIRHVPEARRGAALGITAATVGAGAALGPTLGGLITQFLSWRALFGISALLGIAIPFTRRLLPPSRPTDSQLDLLGGLLLTGVVAGLLIGITNIERHSLESWLVLGPWMASLLSLFLLGWRIRTAPDPFVPPSLLQNRVYLLAGAIAFLQSGAHFGMLVLVPLLLDRVSRLPAFEIGLAMLPSAAVMSLMSPLAGRLADRLGGLPPMRAGLALWAAGMVLLSSAGVGGPPLLVAGLLILCGAGMGLVNSASTVVVSSLLPPERVGLGIGLYNMQFFLGSAFGATLTTSILDSREHVADAWNPLHDGPGAGFSDALLVTLAASLLASLLAAFVRAERPRAESSPPRAWSAELPQGGERCPS